MHAAVRLTAVLAAFLVSQSAGLCVTVGESDTFAVNTENWQQGKSATLRATTGGPAGAGDAYLRITADGSGERGKLVVFNQSQWAGNYLTAGVTSISMAASNFGSTELRLRLAFGSTSDPGEGGTWFASLNPAILPAGSGWRNIQFPIGAADLTRVEGSGSYAALMGNVVTLRLLHSPTPTHRGPNITATLGVDNLLAIGPMQLLGDYNDNGVVDAADYVVWRSNLNRNVTIPNDMTPGMVTSTDYDIWRRHFGSRRSAGGAPGSAPEPSTWLMLAAYSLISLGYRRSGIQSL